MLFNRFLNVSFLAKGFTTSETIDFLTNIVQSALISMTNKDFDQLTQNITNLLNNILNILIFKVIDIVLFML